MASNDYESSNDQIEIINEVTLESFKFADFMLKRVVRSVAGTQYSKYIKDKSPIYITDYSLQITSLISQVNSLLGVQSKA